MSRITVCDICGKRIDKITRTFRIIVGINSLEHGLTKTNRDYDKELCEYCHDDILNFLKNYENHIKEGNDDNT